MITGIWMINTFTVLSALGQGVNPNLDFSCTELVWLHSCVSVKDMFSRPKAEKLYTFLDPSVSLTSVQHQFHKPSM